MAFLDRWLHNKRVGDKGEDLASTFLRSKGLKIVARNYQAGKSEIDIIAISKQQKELHIVEVKSRTSSDWQAVGDSLTSQKINALRRGAFDYIKHHIKYKDYNLVFDVVVVFFEGESNKIEYIENIRF